MRVRPPPLPLKTIVLIEALILALLLGVLAGWSLAEHIIK